MHAQKGGSEAPRTRFRAYKTSKFSGGVPPDPPYTIYIMGPAFCICPGPLPSSRRPCTWHSRFPSSTLTARMQPWIRVGVELFTRPFLPLSRPAHTGRVWEPLGASSCYCSWSCKARLSYKSNSLTWRDYGVFEDKNVMAGSRFSAQFSVS